MAKPKEVNGLAKMQMIRTLNKLSKVQIEKGLLEEYTSEELHVGLFDSKEKKAPDVHGVTAEALKALHIITVELLKEVMDQWAWGVEHNMGGTMLREAWTSLLYKDGDKADPANYRPITILEILLKVMADVTKTRMKPMFPLIFQKPNQGFSKVRTSF